MIIYLYLEEDEKIQESNPKSETKNLHSDPRHSAQIQRSDPWQL